jgi:hypothetical protein
MNEKETINEKGNCYICGKPYIYYGYDRYLRRKLYCVHCRVFKPNEKSQHIVEEKNKKHAIEIEFYVFGNYRVCQLKELTHFSQTAINNKLSKAGFKKKKLSEKPEPIINIFDRKQLYEYFLRFPKIATVIDLTKETPPAFYIDKALLLAHNIIPSQCDLKEIGNLMEKCGYW